MFEVVRTDEFDAWIHKFKDRTGRFRILSRIDGLATGNPGDVKAVGRGISEMRLTYGPGYRVYYLQDGEALNSPADRRRQVNAAEGHHQGP